MCCGEWLCLTAFKIFVEFMPCLCIVATVPIYGSFCGVDLILRVSLLLYVYIVCSELVNCIPKTFLPFNTLYECVPFLKVGILSLIFWYVPVDVIPYPLIWLYDKFLWLSEVLLYIAEVVLALNFVMHCSQRVVEKIEEDESLGLKVLMILLSSSCYAITASFGMAIYKEGSSVQLWLMFVVVVICLAVHNMMWMSHEGILVDAAFTCLCSITVLYAMKEETFLITNPLRTPSTWQLYDRQQDLLSISQYILDCSLGNASLAMKFVMKFVQPYFLVSLLVRLYSILYIVEKIITKFLRNKEDYAEELQTYWERYDERISPYQSPLYVKLGIIFMFTQMSTSLLYESRGISFARFYPLQFLENFYPKDIIWGRIAQVLVVNYFYIWRLYCAEDWQWNDWFSDT